MLYRNETTVWWSSLSLIFFLGVKCKYFKVKPSWKCASNWWRNCALIYKLQIYGVNYAFVWKNFKLVWHCALFANIHINRSLRFQVKLCIVYICSRNKAKMIWSLKAIWFAILIYLLHSKVESASTLFRKLNVVIETFHFEYIGTNIR